MSRPGIAGLLILDIKQRRSAEDRSVSSTPTAASTICHDVKLGITYVERVRLPGRRQERHADRAAHRRRRRRATTASSRGRRPCLIATYPIKHGGKALSVAKGLDRDRAVDESGNQIAVFGRVGTGR